MILTLLVAACGAAIEPISTSPPSASRPPITAIPTSGPFVKTAYPAGGDAPCGQAQAPDAAHAAYTGNLRRIRAKDATTVVFELCDPDVAFLSRLAAPAFSINDSGWLTSHIDPKASGPQAIVGEVNGSGPYSLERWNRGTEISLARSDIYWGQPALNERAIIRWTADSSARVDELRNGTVDGIDDVDPAGAALIADDVGLSLATRPGLNVFYLGFNNTFAPFDNEQVRRAIALGIDRKHIVDSLFPPGSELATHYAPCAIPDGCAGNPWYEYDPIQAKELLMAAGYPDGFDTTIQYREGSRPYLPDPTGVATELQTELLDNLGIRAELVVEPDDTFLADVDAGRLDGIHLLGQSADVADLTSFLDPRFGSRASAEFGAKFDDLAKALASGGATTDRAKRKAAYARANDAIRSHVPMIPVARTGTAAAFRADVAGAAASTVDLERLASFTPGDRRQFVWLTTTEPSGLYCADERDMAADLVCAQLMDTLYAYDPASAAVVPSLARCDSNPELTVWTCKLKPDVLFHDGSTLDANDVVLSFAVQWDAEHPLHLGREGRFPTFAAWFGGFLNPVP